MLRRKGMLWDYIRNRVFSNSTAFSLPPFQILLTNPPLHVSQPTPTTTQDSDPILESPSTVDVTESSTVFNPISSMGVLVEGVSSQHVSALLSSTVGI
jgi:hypothetical protein